MAEFLAEQMRSIARRLMELDGVAPTPEKTEEPKKDTMNDDPLSGSINTRLLADLLDIHDVSLFTQSINKIRTGKADHLNRRELTEMAIAFVNLLDAKQDDTQKAMNILKKVSKKPEEMNDLMEDTGPTADHYKSGEKAGKAGKSEKDNPHKPASPEGKQWIKGWKAGCKSANA